MKDRYSNTGEVKKKELFILNDHWFTNGALYTEGKQRLKRRADCFRQVGIRLSKRGNFHTRVGMGAARWVGTHTHPPESSIYLEALEGFIHIHMKTSEQHTALSGPWKWLPLRKKWAEHTFPGQVRGWETCNCLGPAWEPAQSYVFWMTFPWQLLILVRC